MTEALDHAAVVTGLVGGLALFLFGMDIMTRALKQVAGNSLRLILARLTRNRILGLVAGASVTAIIQSSSVTTVLLVGFISAGLISSANSVAVILGANIGTTITAQILAFEVTALALPVLSAGFFVSALSTRKTTREYGRLFLGLGMIFFGMAVMSEAMTPLRTYEPFFDFMQSLEGVLPAVLLGAGFTALVQSSSATTGVLIVMTGQGLLTLEMAVALALGANVGTCVTALLACIGKRREAVRAALIHTLFNVAGVLIWVGLVDQLADLARLITPGREATAIPRQLANVHTFFNVANALIFVGFTTRIARAAEWLVRDAPRGDEPRFAPRYLDPKFLDVPAIAIDAVRREILRLGEMLRDMLADAVPAVTTGSPLDIDRLRVMDRPVDLLHREIVGYIRQIGLRSLSAAQSAQLMGLIRISNDIEHAGDMIATGLVTSARKRMQEEVTISPETAAAIAGLHHSVLAALDGALRALDSRDVVAAEEVRRMKSDFSALMEKVATHEVARLHTNAPHRLRAYTREMELAETLDDIFKTVRRIARTEKALFATARNGAADA